MYYEIYLDSLFFLQFFMNLYLLGIVNHMLYHAATTRRVILGAFLGAICYILPFFLPLRLLHGVILGGICSFVSMCFFTFRCFEWEALRRIIEKMFLVTLLLGSVLLFVRKVFMPKGRGHSGLIGVLALGALAYWMARKLLCNTTTQDNLCRVILQRGEESLVVEGLLDTGNSLVEPISGKPVSVLEEGAFQKLFSKEQELLYRAIPYHSVGKKNGILRGYLVEEMTVEIQGVKKECRNVYIAVSKDVISEKSGYQIIVNPQVLQK